MRIKEAFKDKNTRIFRILEIDEDNLQAIRVEPTNLKFIPDEEDHFLVRGFEVTHSRIRDCFLDVITTERISEMVFKKGIFGQIQLSDYWNTPNVIPSVASECFGTYELYYSKDNPQIGINVLKESLPAISNVNIAAEDLGYILRDENRNEEAIEAFKRSEHFGPSSYYVYLELSYLYEKIGDDKKKRYYFDKFIDSGGKIFIS